MSFSSKVKDELFQNIANARHCQMAELAAILQYEGKLIEETGELTLQTENDVLVNKCRLLLQKAYNVNSFELECEKRKDGHPHFFPTQEEQLRVLKTLKMLDEEKHVCGIGKPIDGLILKSQCCKRAFLKGAFLCVGSISNPQKGYHLEFVCNHLEQAEQIKTIIQGFQVDAKIIARKKYHVVYLKESESIVDLLNIMGAYVSLMELENMRILKEISNSINRRVNCEAANIVKTVNAATKQIEDIMYIRDHGGLEQLPLPLREMAAARLEEPDATLKELGEMLDPPVGKSGVNHRLRKISEIADAMKY